jgi:hypothetical protein
MIQRLSLSLLSILLIFSPSLAQQKPSLIPPELTANILQEASGERTFQDTAQIAALSRYPASKGFQRAAEIVAEKARQAGLKNVQLHSLPADVPAWDVVSGELWLIEPERTKLADAAQKPVSVVQYSSDADLEAEVIAVGAGTSDADYTGKDVKGKIVLASGPPFLVERQAIAARGAVGIISSFMGEFFGIKPSADAVAWERLSPPQGNEKKKGFAFMVSPNTGKKLEERLAQGRKIKVRAQIKTETGSPGKFGMVTAELPGSLTDSQAVVFSAHLDHQQPGANDNASGSAALLEIARVINKLISDGKIKLPTRTIRFWWVTEIEGTYKYFFAHPDEAQRIMANINIDQAGGDRHGRSDFVAILQPKWMGSFVDDVIRSIATDAMENLAQVYHAPSPSFVAPTGTRGPFLMQFWPYAPLTDHIVFETAGIDIPSISIAAASLDYIHTSEDSMEHIDPTALKRSVYLGAACGLFLANLTAKDIPQLVAITRSGGHGRLGQTEGRALSLVAASTRENVHANFRTAYHLTQQAYEREGKIMASLAKLHQGSTQTEASEMFKYEAGFTWNLFGDQEAAVAMLMNHYQRVCRSLGVEPEELAPSADEIRMSAFIPVRTIALGDGFRAWLEHVSPRLGYEVSEKIKSYLDGKRSLAQVYWAVISEHSNVTTADVEAFVNELKTKGWVKSDERK